MSELKPSPLDLKAPQRNGSIPRSPTFPLQPAPHVQPDALFNDKSQSEGSFSRQPLTVFAHYRRPMAGRAWMETAMNWTPRASYEAADEGYEVDAEQLRLLAALTLPLGRRWLGGIEGRLERSERSFKDLAVGARFQGEDFRRRMHELRLRAALPEGRWSPELGLRWFEIEESGWLGSNNASNGSLEHREWGPWASIVIRRGERQSWEPAIYLTRMEHCQALHSDPLRDRQQRGFQGKLNLPWRYILHRESGAVLTLNATFRLHRAAFGGANLQLHLPF